MKTEAYVADLNKNNDGTYSYLSRSYCWDEYDDRKDGNGEQQIEAFFDVSRDNGFYLQPTNEIDGLIHNRNHGNVYKYDDDGFIRYCVFWLEPFEDLISDYD